MFITDDFMLYNDAARELYHEHAEKLPIIDYHNHLSPREIAEDKTYLNMTEVWLGGDHYKWRAMRARGYSEKLITGDADPYEKFLAYADTVQASIGNPIYHWTHLELKRYFDIDETLDKASAPSIWEKCNEKLKRSEFSALGLLRAQNVKVLCTTDDPVDDLKWHKKIREEIKDISVFPSFRPGNVLDIEKASFKDYIAKLGEVSGIDIGDSEDLISALKERLLFFIENGCRVSDHSLENDFFRPCRKADADRILAAKLKGEQVTLDEASMFRGYILTELGKMYAKYGLAMQLHIGAIRNNSSRMFERVGADTGYDSVNDINYAPQLGALLNEMDKEEKLPKTILYYLNPKDAVMLATMAGCFQGNEEGIKSKVQLGSAWWFNDHLHGMEEQLQVLSDTGLLSGFIGMLTDSRSFLSFPRHEYFRRILCNKVGEIVEKGQYPRDMAYLGKMIEDICYYNAEEYFGLSI
ncbi:MAG: glucuronate isomerase [Eubacterium sp.]|nr:glucuronate isomerase [Eubacterium sp.]